MNYLGRSLYVLCAIATGIIGYNIHNNLFWAIIDWLFAPIAWIKWIMYHEVNLTIIKGSFAFLLN